MDNLGITGYGTLGRTYSSGTSGLESSANNSTSTQSSGSSLDMNDFLQLLAAQFENQDVMNPTDNTEFISELAQFSSLQAMSQLTTYSERQYAASLVGKTVEMGTYDKTGQYVMKKGVVESTAFGSDGCGILLEGDNTSYKLTDVVMVLNETGSNGGSEGGT
ncbi:flagellar hook assembly protein FlgD [Caproicibacter sp.]|uniref:flagellar hook assembly protein FlgD n=1 Tax=Caproicibacter sp. TaxID=2814884 RepID=UPI00398A21D3